MKYGGWRTTRCEIRYGCCLSALAGFAGAPPAASHGHYFMVYPAEQAGLWISI